MMLLQLSTVLHMLQFSLVLKLKKKKKKTELKLQLNDGKTVNLCFFFCIIYFQKNTTGAEAFIQDLDTEMAK